MSNHPIIKALQAELAKERENQATAKNLTLTERYYYTHAHEAATERLLTYLEKAVEMAEFYGGDDGWAVADCSSEGEPGKKAREFLTTLADAGESEKED